MSDLSSFSPLTEGGRGGGRRKGLGPFPRPASYLVTGSSPFPSVPPRPQVDLAGELGFGLSPTLFVLRKTIHSHTIFGASALVPSSRVAWVSGLRLGLQSNFVRRFMSDEPVWI